MAEQMKQQRLIQIIDVTRKGVVKAAVWGTLATCAVSVVGPYVIPSMIRDRQVYHQRLDDAQRKAYARISVLEGRGVATLLLKPYSSEDALEHFVMYQSTGCLRKGTKAEVEEEHFVVDATREVRVVEVTCGSSKRAPLTSLGRR